MGDELVKLERLAEEASAEMGRSCCRLNRLVNNPVSQQADSMFLVTINYDCRIHGVSTIVIDDASFPVGTKPTDTILKDVIKGELAKLWA